MRVHLPGQAEQLPDVAFAVAGGRRSQGPPCRGRCRQDAGLCRLLLRRLLVEVRASGRRPAGGHGARL